MRIATLVPSATDLVCDLGLADALVGVSHECDHPAAQGLPVLTRSNVPAAPATAPGEVDRAVNETVAAGDSLYVADRDRLAELAPDVVVGQSICDVCAVSEPLAQASLPAGADLVLLSATSIAGLKDDLTRLGQALGRSEAAAARIQALDAALDALPSADGQRVLALEWSDPPFLGGHWIPELVERVGGTHVLSGPGAPSRRATWAEIRDAEPRTVVFMPCGYGLDAARAEARACPSLLELDAEIWATDATRLYSRCTTEAVMLGAETLAQLLTGGPVPPDRAARIR